MPSCSTSRQAGRTERYSRANGPRCVFWAWRDAARGRGLSRRLTEWCIARARQQGATEIGLHTSEAMTIARGLYERMGFVVDGDLPMNFGLRY